MPNTYQSDYTGQHNDNYEDRIAILEAFKETFLNTVYPVGSIYMSMNNTNPSTLFGGTWERISGRFLLGVGGSNGPGANSDTQFGQIPSSDQSTYFNNYTLGNTGGEYSHTLTTAQTPAHTHTRGTMNITGAAFTSHSQGICYLNVAGCTGAFYGTTNVTNCGKVAVNGTFSGAAALGLDASKNWTGATSSVGGNGSHNNIPPYLAVAMWKRIA